MRRRRIASMVGVMSLLSVWLTATSVSAEVLRQEPFADTSSYEYSDCGYPIQVEAQFEGTSSIRVGKNGDASVFFVRERVSYREVHTNTLTGEWFVVRGHATFHEIKATQVEGSIYEVTAQQAGQPYVIEDSSGRLVARDRGLIRFTYLFDTGGDDDPAGQFVEFLGADLRGPHPGFEGSTCGIVGDLIGISDSSDRYTVHPVGATTSPLGYTEYLPPDYADDTKSPLLVFLHGAGESGDGSAEQLDALTATAIPAYIAADGWPDDRPFVVLAPQHEIPADLPAYAVCDGVPYGGSCAMSVQHELGHPDGGSVCFTPEEVQTFLTYAIAAYDVDPSRVYLTGLSCGAFGAWEYVAAYGDSQVAAVVPIAGDGRPAWQAVGCALGEAPLWAFHGAADDVVDPQGSIEPITGLQACTSPPAEDARLTIYPDRDHDSWTATYALGADDDIYAWMLSFSTI